VPVGDIVGIGAAAGLRRVPFVGLLGRAAIKLGVVGVELVEDIAPVGVPVVRQRMRVHRGRQNPAVIVVGVKVVCHPDLFEVVFADRGISALLRFGQRGEQQRGEDCDDRDDDQQFDQGEPCISHFIPLRFCFSETVFSSFGFVI